VPISPQPPDVAEKTADGETPDSTPTDQGAVPPGAPPPTAQTQEGPPGPPEQEAAQARAERMVRQMRTQHMLTFMLEGTKLLHPKLCGGHLYSCPFTLELSARPPDVRPGMFGTYAARIDAYGRLRIDNPMPYVDPTAFYTTESNRHVPA
jgi:hypothetical protein